jgi:hypothetical protein
MQGIFVKCPRSLNEPGRGGYWGLDASNAGKLKRTRKRGHPKSTANAANDEDEDYDEDTGFPVITSALSSRSAPYSTRRTAPSSFRPVPNMETSRPSLCGSHTPVQARSCAPSSYRGSTPARNTYPGPPVVTIDPRLASPGPGLRSASRTGVNFEGYHH